MSLYEPPHRWTTRYNSSRQRKRRLAGNARLVCVNCGSEGHILRDCRAPTTSFGVVAVRQYYPGTHVGPIQPPVEHRCEKHLVNIPDAIPPPEIFPDQPHGYLFLMVQRKDTMGFIDFVRGKYPPNEPEKTAMLRTYLSEMTCDERRRLRSGDFQCIWDVMWRNHASKSYISEFIECQKKFERLDIAGLLNETECQWTEQEYGFPKGRKNIRETDETCAVREFCEESGYRRHEIRLRPDGPFEENFQGTNGVRYRHVYYLAEVSRHVQRPRMDTDNIQQVGEVRNVGWFTLDQCLSVIRPYDTAKKDLLRRVHERLRASCRK